MLRKIIKNIVKLSKKAQKRASGSLLTLFNKKFIIFSAFLVIISASYFLCQNDINLFLGIIILILLFSGIVLSLWTMFFLINKFFNKKYKKNYSFLDFLIRFQRKFEKERLKTGLSKINFAILNFINKLQNQIKALKNIKIKLNLIKNLEIKKTEGCNQEASIKRARKIIVKNNSDYNLILPLYFGWEIAIRRIRNWRQHATGPFKKRWQYAAAVMFLIVSISAYLFFSSNKNTLAATKNFIQASWNTLSSNTANNTDNRNGWTEYSATSTSITASSTIMIATTASSTTQTIDADFNIGTFSSAATSSNNVILGASSTSYILVQTNESTATSTPTNLTGGFNTPNSSFTFTTVSGSGASADVRLTSSWVTGTTYTTSGSKSWTAPAGVTSVQVELWGGGANGSYDPGDFIGGAGGGGAAYSKKNSVSVTSGNSYTVYVGGNDQDSYFINTATVLAKGGSGSSGGQAGSGVGDVKYSGAGGTVGGCGGGNGGGAAGNAADATGQTGGTAGGGNGGYGGDCFGSDGLPGSAPGGGGGGGGGDEGGSWGGGAGAAGKAILTHAGVNAYETTGTSTSYMDAGLALNYSWSNFKFTKSSTSGDGAGSIIIKIKSSSSSTSAPSDIGSQTGNCSITATSDAETSPSDISACAGTGRYLWYQAVLTTSDISKSPKINDVTVTATQSNYQSAGTFDSGIIDIGFNVPSWGNLSWTAGGTGTIAVKARACSTSNCSDGTAWGSCGNITSGSALTSGSPNCVIAGKRYVQYQATLSGDMTTTPSLNDVTIGYNYYPSGQTLTSSAFNSESSANVMGGISWDENSTLPSDTYVALQLRASSSAVLLSTTDWSAQLTSTSTGCSKAGSTVTCLVTALPAWMTDLSGNQWFQYRVYLSSNGSNSPQVDNINVAYVVNDPPEVQAVTASSTSSGLVSFSYQVRDSDTDEGSPGNQYKITPSFQYSTNGGLSWTDITSDLSVSATTTKTVATSTWNTYYATWNAKNAINNTYSTTFQIKAIANDGEAANFTASSTSANFTVDTRNPASPSIVVVATTTPATLRLSASDDSSLQMRIGLLSDTSDGSWVTYATASTTSITDDPETVYVQFRDAYGNTSSVASAVTPETPTAMMIQDTSNLNTTPIEYRLFVAWEVVNPEPTPGFAAYRIYRSTDNITYSFRYEETNININSYADSSVSYNTVYYYKVYTIDDAGNASYLSSSVNGNANGTQDAGEGGGGSDATAPAISAIDDTAATTQSVTITWTTNELSNSTVGYCLSPCSDYTTEQGVASYVTSHSVVLTGLTPGTTYDYKVISSDPSTNIASTTGNSFVTNSGPSITANSVSIIEVTNNTAKITWDTDIAASGYVVYSTTSPPAGTESFTDTLATSRTITLLGLTAGTKYYFYVKSRDGSGNWAYDYNDLNGTRNYFNFTTDSDSTAPTITFNSGTDITSIADTSATVSWTTNETATSTLEYGFTTSYASSTLSNNNYNSNHSFDLSSLTAGTTYYIRLKSTDANANTAITTSSFTTTDSSDIVAPTISGVSANPIYDTVAVINWTTNESATSVVNYGTGSGVYTLASSSSALNLSHSIILTGLTANTAYYYALTSVDSNSNATTSIEYNFTTMETLSEESAVAAREAAARTAGVNSVETTSGGGGFIIIDKTDSAPPVISNISVSDIKSDSVKINWETNEEADTFIEYGGGNSNYDLTIGKYEMVKQHALSISNLFLAKNYYFRIVARDSSGNLSYSSEQGFITLSALEELKALEEKIITKDETAPSLEEVNSENILIDTVKKAIEIVSKLASKVSISTLESSLFSQQESIEKLASVLPPPLLIGSPAIEISATTATVSWGTDKEASSLVAIASEPNFRPNAPADEKYAQTIGNPNIQTTTHKVIISDLEPNMVYHYKIMSKSAIGALSESSDYTFKTREKTIEITNYSIDKISTEEAVFKWATNIEASSAVKFIPYRNNALAVDEAREITDKAVTTIHEIGINEFEGGVVYNVELASKDTAGNVASRSINAFSTSEDDLPPMITQVQTDSAISPGKESKVQTVISWMTNEPSTSKVYFDKGFGDEEKMSEETKMDQNYTKKHVVVITKFDTGSVYRFRVESIDSKGNTTTSRIYTILTPRQKETVFQIIMKNVEDLFGWVGEINK